MDFIENEIIEQIKKKNLSLLWQVELSKEQFKEICIYTKNKIEQLKIHQNAYPDLKLSCALSFISYSKYKDGNLWDYLSDYFKIPVNKKVIIGQIFLETLRTYNLFEIEKLPDANNQYVQNILAHCVVPKEYKSGFYELLLSFYDRNLGGIVSENIDDEICSLREFMQTSLNSQNDEISFEKSKEHMAVSYKLIKSTKSLFAQCQDSIINQYIKTYLYYFDDYFCDRKNDNIPEDFKDWLNKKFDKDQRKKFHEFANIERFRNSTPFLTISTINQKAYIVIPKRKFHNSIRECKYKIVQNGTILKDDYLDLYLAQGYVASEKKFIEIKMDSIFDKFEIFIEDKLIKTIISSEIRIFNEIKNVDNSYKIDKYEVDDIEEGEACIVVKKGSCLQINQNNILYKDNYSFPSADIYIVNINKDTIILVNNITIGTNLLSDDNFIQSFYDMPLNFNMTTEEGEPIICTYSHPKIYFKNPQEYINQKAFLKCNKQDSIINIEKNITYVKNDSQTYGYIDLNQHISEEVDEYTISLNTLNSGKQICHYLLISKDLSFKSDSSLYVFKDTAIILKQTEEYIQPINCKKIPQTSKYQYTINEGDNIVRFKIGLNDNEYGIDYILNIMQYSFDERNWFNKKKDYVWDNELKNYLYIKMPRANQLSIYLENDSYFPIYPNEKKGYFEFDISKITEKFKSNELKTEKLILSYFINGREQKEIFSTLTNKIDIKKFSLDYDLKKDSAYIDTKFYPGEYKFKVKLINNITGRTFEKYLDNGRNYIEELDKYACFNITQIMEKETFWGEKETRKIATLENLSPINQFEISENSQIIINNLYYKGIRYPLGCGYQISQIRRNFGYYWGVLYQNMLNNNTSLPINFKITNHDKIFLYLPNKTLFCYDSQTKKLLKSQDGRIKDIIRKTKDKERFITLDEKNTYFSITVNEKRNKEYDF